MAKSAWTEAPYGKKAEPSTSDIARFFSKVDKNGPIVRKKLGRCWLWTRSRTDGGYGQFGIGGTTKPAHRFSWSIHRGIIPPNAMVLHQCDTAPCVNPKHLYLGTAKDNRLDRTNRGSALRNPQVRKAREAYAFFTIEERRVLKQFAAQLIREASDAAGQ